MPNNELNRRHFIASGLALALLPMPALAQTEAAAKALVNSVVADINRVIDSGKSEKAMLRDFEKIFVQYGDVPIMARYALGADARTASPAQLKKFTKAFQGYISRKYGRRFREFIGGEVDVRNARKIKAGYEVRTLVKLRGSAPFDVTFLVSDKSGRDKFYNMFIEGVNLLLTERTEIGAMLDARKGNLDQLIRDLNKTG
ncbi:MULTISPECIES: phospholipid-binding protein MlaC [unclassified Ruegeria]|uniref:MlaC/ttg2D family ABC transporter substrate-binding protein n=1 Tax=unclassified Ruegeria TaxID=2625375 RepID=UPI001489FFC9|nr:MULTISPECIES: ABC transporter substrate-binding protein [unclassified Ruegeria]NOD76275.1 ABC transporter substrate-binding protein [Ruegeria sp. HKCCD4332]NOD90231.1 ABC transporter substrate-binding protein [Ruegeria sp. HKCCD4318]NOD94334.1 ABC transporter substrate-binding protein [Ruegeria sp. HKCCD4884]NOE15304.1 ABC transporter substrate-binding protein [Ruegeria sp. HKCCD4318-2]NOG10486.1 ABC transporter substrate-binding protein [Ruegeria sp. HKCCD4315]